MYCVEACMCALFSPELLQAGAVKGLMLIDRASYSCFLDMEVERFQKARTCYLISTPPSLLWIYTGCH